MANTINAEIIRTARSTAFLEDVQSNLVASKVANIRKDQRDKVIHNPYRDRAVATIGTAGTQVCEITPNDITTGDESITIDVPITVAEAYCADEKRFTTVDLEAESLREMNNALYQAVDRHFISEAIAQATRTVPAITDSATADSSTRTALSKIAGLSGAPLRDRVAIIGTDLVPYFMELGATQVRLEPSDLLTGDIYNLNGFEVYVVNNDTDATLNSLPVQIPAGEFLLMARNAVDLYIEDIEGKGMNIRTKEVSATTGGNISLKEAQYAVVYVKTKIWRNRLPLVFKKGI